MTEPKQLSFKKPKRLDPQSKAEAARLASAMLNQLNRKTFIIRDILVKWFPEDSPIMRKPTAIYLHIKELRDYLEHHK